jgi:hypothetical protein
VNGIVQHPHLVVARVIQHHAIQHLGNVLQDFGEQQSDGAVLVGGEQVELRVEERIERVDLARESPKRPKREFRHNQKP